MDIYQSLNSIITHVVEFCDINNNIEIIIELEKRKEKKINNSLNIVQDA